MYRYGIMRQSSKSLGTHGVCAKQFCTSIPVCPMGDLIPCTCADIQVLQRALVALIRIAHGRRILDNPEVYIRDVAYLRYSLGTPSPDPFGLEIITGRRAAVGHPRRHGCYEYVHDWLTVDLNEMLSAADF